MSTPEQTPVQEEKAWFYEKNGQRIGALTEIEMRDLIDSQALTYGSSVWCKGHPDWMKIENTELRKHLEIVVPPPLTGDHVNNTVVWFLAFAPIIGHVLEYLIADIVYTDRPLLAARAMREVEFWYVTIILYIGLSFWDEHRLKKAGTDTSKFKGFVWLVPVYLFQRAKALKHNLAYFVVWIVCFLVALIAADL